MRTDPLTLLPAQLTAHQPPALLVDGILACDEATGRGRLRGPLDAMQLIEGCAQILACLMGVRMRRAAAATGAAGQAASGMLVGVKDVVFGRPAGDGDVILVDCEQTHVLGPFQLHRVTAVGADGAVLLTGEWKTVSTTSTTGAEIATP